MGYHRDPERLGFSPFEKEMRRRTWSLCMQLDLLTSFHLGLPSSIQYSTWDTRTPSILLDTEFDEDSVILPTPAPGSELAGMPFYIAKHLVMVVFEKVLRHVLTVRTDALVADEVSSLDSELRSVYATLPKILQRRPMSECCVDPPSLIVTRLCVSFLYNKSLCVLHRLYVTKGRDESIRECHAAASAMVEDLLDAYRECKPGGVLETEQWMMSSITWHDFLLGTTSLCMVLCATSSRSDPPCQNRLATLNLLERARIFCAEKAGGRNKDTARVLSIIEATIRHDGKLHTQGHQELAACRPSPCEEPVVDVPPAVSMDWPWTEGAVGTLGDANWVYLDQFLGFSNSDTRRYPDGINEQ